MQRNDPVLAFFIITWKKRERVVPLYWMSSWNVLFDEDKHLTVNTLELLVQS